MNVPLPFIAAVQMNFYFVLLREPVPLATHSHANVKTHFFQQCRDKDPGSFGAAQLTFFPCHYQGFLAMWTAYLDLFLFQNYGAFTSMDVAIGA